MSLISSVLYIIQLQYGLLSIDITIHLSFNLIPNVYNRPPLSFGFNNPSVWPLLCNYFMPPCQLAVTQKGYFVRKNVQRRVLWLRIPVNAMLFIKAKLHQTYVDKLNIHRSLVYTSSIWYMDCLAIFYIIRV